MKTRQCLSAGNLWECGDCSGFEREDGGALLLSQKTERGIYISDVYDSGQEKTEWNRLLLDISAGTIFCVHVYLFDNEWERDYLKGAGDIGQKAAYILERAQYVSHYREVLLYGEKKKAGRFAAMCVELFSGNTVRADVFYGYALSFPRENFSKYLPTVYQDNEQLERYMAVLQSIYLQLEEKIDLIPRELDYEYCEEAQVRKLAAFLGYGELAETAGAKALRTLLQYGVRLPQSKGTKQYYEIMGTILSGQKAVLAEEKEAHRCLLLIKGRPEEEGERCLEWLRKQTPLGVQMDITFLHRTARLDGQYFLDVTAGVYEKEWELLVQGTPTEDLILL